MLARRAGSTVARRAVQLRVFSQKTPDVSKPKTLSEPRAVTKEEAPNVQGAAKSSEETMMPWRGWFDAYLKEKLSDKQYQRIRNTFHWKPDDPYNLQQVPNPNTKIPIGNEGQEAAFREVSPGSQPPVDVPKYDLDDDPYDSGYFKRDTRRRYIDPEFPQPDVQKIRLEMMDPDDPEVQEAKKELADGPKSSPGNKGVFPTGPSDFDPTGLRANMSVTHKALQESLDKYMPNHLPTPVWANDGDELVNWYKERDLPVPPGKAFNYVRRERRVARW